MARVLIATDGSDFAVGAARRAVEILGSEHRFIVVSVMSNRVILPMGEPLLPGAGAAIDGEQVAEADEKAREQALEDVDMTIRGLGVAAEPAVLVGDPAEEICRYASEISADVVVIGSHGSGLLKRVLVGSVSHHVVHHSPCPVLLIRTAPHKVEAVAHKAERAT